MSIINLTQHAATADQIEAGVFDLSPQQRATISQWLTFSELPRKDEIDARAVLIAHAAAGKSRIVGNVPQAKLAMIGGAPWLMGPLAGELLKWGIQPLFAFSTRVVEEQPQADGSVRKMASFKHIGFVPAA